jgi:nitrogen regulation protein NR(I)
MTQRPQVVVVDDEERMRTLVSKVLGKQGYAVRAAADGPSALRLLEEEPADLVLTDVKMPGMDGLELLRAVRETLPEAAVILMTAFGSIDAAVQAMRQGAYDYISKPFKIEELQVICERALEQRRLKHEVQVLRQEIGGRYQFGNLTGKSPAMQEVFRLIEQVAPSKSTVMISGKSGTGKELVAKAIHYNSPRRDKRFVPVNCAAIPAELLESELFGHEKGAFTGAIQTKIGKFELANGGTLFLDEVGTMRLDLQAKILRALQEREFTRVGGTRTIQVDVRVIAATNQDLRQMVSEGLFREDLYYRLNVVPITVPPLRDRPEDVPLLANHFLKRFAEETGSGVTAISPAAMQILMGYAWPGNVRELENAIERAVTLARHPTILPEDLPQHFTATVSPVERAMALDCSLEDLERQYIQEVLKRTRGHQTRTAAILGIDRRTLYRKIRRYGLALDKGG